MDYDKIKEHKEFLDHAKKPSFNIKKMFDQNFRKSKEKKESKKNKEVIRDRNSMSHT